MFSLSLTSKRFHQICLSFDEYKKRLRLSKQLLGYDVDAQFDFFNDTMRNLLKDIKAGFENVFVDRKFIFSVLELKLRNICFDLLPFRIFSHLFFCHSEARSAGRCDICTRFYVERYKQHPS